MGNDVRAVTWSDVQVITKDLAALVAADGPPQVIVGIARGGLIPGVMIAHVLGVRDLRTLTITHTESDAVNAAKTPEPLVAHPGSLGDLAGQDVLVVDDIAGTGDTLTLARTVLAERNPSRVRTGVLRLNLANWQFPNPEPTYVGGRDRGWVVFPWRRDRRIPDAGPAAGWRQRAQEHRRTRGSGACHRLPLPCDTAAPQ